MKKLLTILLLIASPSFAIDYSTGDKFVCSFNKILRFSEGEEPYMTESYSNQSPFSFTVNEKTITMSDHWFVGATLDLYSSKYFNVLYATNGEDMIKLYERNGRISGYGGTMDSYIKMFYLDCLKA
jgi:hypothetical protein